MALLNESVESKKFDVRMIERNIARGVIAPADRDAAVAALPDDAENADWVSLDSFLGGSEEASTASNQHQH